MSITVTNAAGNKLNIRRVNLLDCHGNIVGNYPDDHECAVQIMQDDDARTARTMTLASAMSAVEKMRTAGMTVEGDL